MTVQPGSKGSAGLRAADPGWDKHAMETYPADCCCPFTNPETVGYVEDNAVLGTVIMSNIFLSAAITHLALEAAGCGYLNAEDLDDDPEDCEGLVYGIRPTNVIPYVVTIGGFVVAMLMPITGSIMDHTPWRKQICIYSGAVIALVSAAQAVINKDTWEFVALLQIASIASYVVHQLSSGSYLPEIGSTQNESMKANAWSSLFMFTTQLGYMFFVSAVSIAVLGGGTVATAAFGQAVCGASLVVGMGWVFARLLRRRDQTQHIPAGQNAASAGLYKLASTVKNMRTNYPGTFLYLIGLMFTEAAMASFASLAQMYIQVQLGASGIAIASVIVTLLVVAAPTTILAVKMTESWGEKYGEELGARRLFVATLLYLAVSTCIAPFVMTGPERFPFVYVASTLCLCCCCCCCCYARMLVLLPAPAPVLQQPLLCARPTTTTTTTTAPPTNQLPASLRYLFAAIWGVGFGFYYSLNSAVYVYIIPGGEEAKYIGVKLCASNLLNWLPPLIFTQLNRIFNSVQFGLLVFALFLPIGALCIALIDMKDARARVVDSLSKRQGEGRRAGGDLEMPEMNAVVAPEGERPRAPTG